MTALSLITLLLLASAEPAAEAKPADFINVSTLAPQIEVHMAYAGSDNFVGQPIEGYQANICYLQQDAARALAQVQQAARARGYTLWVFDCYRPQRAVNHFMRWASDLSDTRTKAQYYPNLAKDTLVGDYIAEKSGHSRGSTVDLTLAARDADGRWRPLDMGSAFDLFDPISNVGAAGISAAQQANRQLLEMLMLSGGFKVYNMEWWHFTHQPAAYPQRYFDFIVR